MQYHFSSHAKYGDNLEQLNYVRRLAAQYPNDEFTQGVNQDQLEQLAEVIEDEPRISLRYHGDSPKEAHSSWIGYEGFCHQWPNRQGDRVGFMVAWFHRLSERAGLESPIHGVNDLLFNYPALLKPTVFGDRQFDIMVINSEPGSGQYRGYSRERIDQLAKDLSRSNQVVTIEPVEGLPSTKGENLTLTGIGSLSRQCRAVVGISTGPMWPTFNVWNSGTDFIYLVDNEHINYGPKFTKAYSESHIRDILTELRYP